MRVAVRPELLHWALERSYKSMDDLRGRFPQLVKWVAGRAQPTFAQLQDFSLATATPFGYFFLPEPPEERLPVPDYRTVSDRPMSRPSADLLDTLHTMQRRQDWMHETMADQGVSPLPFVGIAKLMDDPEIVAKEMRATVGLTETWAESISTWQLALGELRRAMEEIGVLSVINGVVGNNTHRVLSVSEFRGFALVDELAPLIFVNGADAKSAQMFTLAHELAHVWLGREGVSGFSGLDAGGSDVEIFCNKAAAEFLVPGQVLRKLWRMNGQSSIQETARLFKVSPVVAARRALDLRLIDRDNFFAFYNEHISEERAAVQETKGGNFYTNQNARIGKRFATEVFRAAKEGRLLYDDAYRLTGLRGETFNKYVQYLGFDVL